MDLEQIEMVLSLKLEAGQADGYFDFVHCTTEIKYRNNFEMMSEACACSQPRLLVLSSSEMVKFDADLMFLCLRMKMADGAATGFLEIVLCQRKRNIVLLDQTGEVGLDRFLAI
ncbi:hypothetical protein BpHYR1_033010 [Brachionus plicatilis]|uniref:Uncharacterized protein n=1 Tax=Brachionus plicatilis TaxID=10195 RepID=A0A3M7RA68_BRAPC|nr:hypothetical protein BpHYR1_033010 [Brachionus plicatilis]